jgi:hypothetical protein
VLLTPEQRAETERRISQIDDALRSIQRIVANDGVDQTLECDALYRERAILKQRLKDR